MDADSAESAREGVDRAVKQSPSLLRRGSATAVLTLLASAALAPAVVAIAGGGAVVTAVGGIAGGIGAGQLTALTQRCAERIRGKPKEELRSAAEAALVSDLTELLERGDANALQVQAGLVRLLDRFDAFDTALESAADDLRERLDLVFRHLADTTSETLDRLENLGVGQAGLIDMVESMRSEQAEGFRRLRGAGPIGQSVDHLEPGSEDLGFVLAEPVPAPPRHDTWAPGTEVALGRGRFLLYDLLVDERRSPDGTAVLRRAVAMRRDASGGRGGRFVWLRQVRCPHPGPVADATREALRREHRLLDAIGSVRGLPAVDQLDSTGDTVTSVLIWPAAGRERVPCETLGVLATDDGRPLDPWAAAGSYLGLSGLCRTLSALHRSRTSHRDLALDGIVMADAQTLVLRDLGNAGRPPRHGETSCIYTAPEQRRRGPTPPGPATDVYQIAAIAYHLTAGHPPPRMPAPPLRTRNPDCPAVLEAALTSALSHEPDERPPIQTLADALQSATDALK
ncbi:hypothetical protein L0U85_12230 [Glycomyces sp. L485]|uniref:hypothetical protein n=1 Tax=Glycomyces sp. L485 TaxID=2909235 RepID=UPI001F4BAE33|nr:hypothetical protein [Glycomyces sp. L485]MCH7231612.1 hypothetical protein [Glycomyces sp. L485]